MFSFCFVSDPGEGLIHTLHQLQTLTKRAAQYYRQVIFPFLSVKSLQCCRSPVVDCLTRDRGAVGLSLIGVTVLCP